ARAGAPPLRRPARPRPTSPALSPEVVARERAEPLAGFRVRADRAFLGVLGIGGDLLGGGAHLRRQGRVMRRSAERPPPPTRGAAVRGDVVLEQVLAEQPGAPNV